MSLILAAGSDRERTQFAASGAVLRYPSLMRRVDRAAVFALVLCACGHGAPSSSMTDSQAGTSGTSTSTGSTGELDEAALLCDCDENRVACGPIEKWPGLQGCDLASLSGSSIVGSTPLGPFSGDRSLFSLTGYSCWWSECQQLQLHIVDVSVDLASFVEDTDGQRSLTFVSANELNLLEGSTGWGALHWDGEFVAYTEAEVVDVKRHGSWYVADPSDPPRLSGTLRVMDPLAGLLLEGPFEAVYCDSLTDFASCS